MRLAKFAALSLLLSAGAAAMPLERAMAQGAPPPPAQAAPPAQPAPPPTAAAPAPAGPPPAVTHSNVNLREGPGTSYTVVTLIPGGSSVEVGECKSGWCQVTFQGQNGYIIESSIAPGAPAARARPMPPPGYAGGPPPGYAGGPPPGYAVPPPGYYYPPPPYAYGYGYGPYYRPYWGWRRGYGYWRHW